MLLDDSVAVARLAALADVPVTLDVWSQRQHFFQLGVGVYPEAAAALARAGAWLQERWADGTIDPCASAWRYGHSTSAMARR